MLHSIEVLHSYLTYGLETDEQKIRAFYIWLISHIIYDYDAYRGKTHHKNAPFQIIYSGKAVCAGYANMFMELCQLSKIDCVYIVGWSKKDVLEPIDNSNCHAWNKVMYNGEWKLIDCTWSALGYDFFYCTPPEKFVATHFPFDPEYQLLSPPITIETFMNLKPIWF